MHKYIPYVSLLWAVAWYGVSRLPAKSDTGNDAVAFILSCLGWFVFIGWCLWAIWRIS